MRLLEGDGFTCREAGSGVEALRLMEAEAAPLIISDLRMPEMDGVTLLKEVVQRWPGTAVIMVTAVAEVESAVACLKQGALDYVAKPFHLDEVRARVTQAIEKRRLVLENRDYHQHLEERVDAQARRIEELFLEGVHALAKALEAKDAYTRGHSERVGVYATKLAREMGLPKERIERVYIAGLLHDVGKIGVRDAVITKPDRLTDVEYDEMKEHPIIGAKILEPVDFLSDVAPCVRHHHEWYDGSARGYPERLRGEQIPLGSRIILVSDTVEAMTSDRPYRKGLPLDVVIAELHKYSGSQFDPSCVDPMLRLLDREGEDFIKKDQKFDIFAFLEI